MEFVIKFFYDTNINKNRVTRANNLKGLVPEVIGSTKNFYKKFKKPHVHLTLWNGTKKRNKDRKVLRPSHKGNRCLTTCRKAFKKFTL